MKKAEMEHWLKVYRQLNKTPIEAPCDVCKERIHPDRVQGCDRCGCGPVNLYVRLKAYNKLKGSLPSTTGEKGVKP